MWKKTFTTISASVRRVCLDFLKLPMFNLVSFFTLSSIYFNEALAYPDFLPRMSIQHQLINQQVQVVTTGLSRHSDSPMEESPGLFKILAWRTPARPSQVTVIHLT